MIQLPEFKIFLSGYPVEKRVIWGTDNDANNYNIDYARYWANLDRGIIGEIAQNAESFRCPGCPERKFNSLWEAVSENNFQRFFGKQEGGAA